MILDQTFPPDSRVENEALTLIERGFEVYLFCLSYEGKSDEENHKGIKVKRFASSPLEYKLSALAYTFSLYSKKLSLKIKRFLRQNSIDVIHIHDMRIAEASFLANSDKLPMVLDLHENRPEIMKYYPHLQKFPGKFLISINRWKRKEEEFVRKANRVIVVTEAAKKELVERTKVDSSKIAVVPNSVRKSFYQNPNLQTEIIEKYKGSWVVLYVGDTNLRRGLLTAIEASAELSKHIENYKLVVVGSNTTDTVLKQRVKELQLEKFIDFMGWQDVSLFPSYISVSQVCISPLHRNIHHDTTYANKIFQYMSLSKPLVVSDATAQAAIVNQAKSGLVHVSKDIMDYTEKIKDLYHNPSKARDLGTNGKKFIEEKFSWEITSKALTRLYDEFQD